MSEETSEETREESINDTKITYIILAVEDLALIKKLLDTKFKNIYIPYLNEYYKNENIEFEFKSIKFCYDAIEYLNELKKTENSNKKLFLAILDYEYDKEDHSNQEKCNISQSNGGGPFDFLRSKSKIIPLNDEEDSMPIQTNKIKPVNTIQTNSIMPEPEQENKKHVCCCETPCNSNNNGCVVYKYIRDNFKNIPIIFTSSNNCSTIPCLENKNICIGDDNSLYQYTNTKNKIDQYLNTEPTFFYGAKLFTDKDATTGKLFTEDQYKELFKSLFELYKRLSSTPTGGYHKKYWNIKQRRSRKKYSRKNKTHKKRKYRTTHRKK